MKKILVVIMIILLIGCTNNKEIDNDVEDSSAIKEEKNLDTEEEAIKDNNPIKLALYVDRKRVGSYNSTFSLYKDIVSLECYYTNDDSVISGNIKDVFNSYYNNYQDIDKYKIGYRIKFDIPGETVIRYIYRPSDVLDYFNYIQTYLYDDIHQDSSWYSHVEDKNYNDNTLLTSIKLTGSTDIDKVSSDIEIMVFSYTKDDININNEYVGKNYYTVLIKRV